MNKKQIETDFVSVPLFGTSPAYVSKPARKTIMVIPSKDEQGNRIALHTCVEDKMSEIVPLNFQDASLSSLVEHGVNPHALDMVDRFKMGCDDGVDALANHIINNASDFVELSKS